MPQTLVWFLGGEDPLEKGWLPTVVNLGFPCGSAGKERVALQCGRSGFNPWIGKISWRTERLPTPVFWCGEFHGLYNPWGHKELDTTEWLHFHFSLSVLQNKSNYLVSQIIFRQKSNFLVELLLEEGSHPCPFSAECRRGAWGLFTTTDIPRQQEGKTPGSVFL